MAPTEAQKEAGNYKKGHVRIDGFDEHKVMYGFPDIESARKAYLSNYEDGWQGLGAITHVSKEEFKKWVESSRRKTKPFAEYKSVKAEGAQGGEAEAAAGEQTENREDDEIVEPKPIGSGLFGNIYDQFKGKVKEAFVFLMRTQGGQMRAVFHRSEVGDVDLVWGNGKAGLMHIILKHVVNYDDFSSVEEVIEIISDVMNNGKYTVQKDGRVAYVKDKYCVAIEKSENGNWIVTALDTSRKKKEKKRSEQDATLLHQSIFGDENGELVSQQPALTTDKDNTISSNVQGNGKKKTGKPTPVQQKGREKGPVDDSGKPAEDYVSMAERVAKEDEVRRIAGHFAEETAVENSFLVLVKDGVPTVIHLGMGSYANTMAPYGQALVAYRALEPERVYFVHNHPSGVLKASVQDRNLLIRVKQAFGVDVVQEGIIIDTKSGKYGTYDVSADGYNMTQSSGEGVMPAASGAEVPLKVYQFSRQVFSSDWNPERAFQIVSKESVAEFVSSHRLGERKKMSFLVLDNGNKVVANLFLPWTRLGDIKDIREAARVLAGYVHQCGGARGVLYGNYEYTPDDGARLRNLSARMKELEAPFLDALHVEHSARDYGLLREPGGEEEAGAEIRKVDATASIRKGEIRKLAKEISEDRADKSSGRLVVLLSKSSPDERKALKEAISQESNGTLADLAKRAKDISEMAAEHIEVKPVSKKEFAQLIHDNKDEVTVIDDGMRVSFGSNNIGKIYNSILSEKGVANEIIRLMKGAQYAYSQPHNNTGEQRGSGSVHPDRENALEYRNYVNKFSNGEGTFYLRFVVMRMTNGDSKSHGAVISYVSISKENAVGGKANDAIPGALPGAIPRSTGLSSGYTLKPDTKLQNFFEVASKGREIFDGKIYKIPLKGEDVVVYGVEKEGGDVPEAPASYRIVDDPELLNELEDGEWEEAYRVMQVIDGELYPPMAAVRDH